MKEETKKALKEVGLESLENVTKEAVEDVFKCLEIIIKD